MSARSAGPKTTAYAIPALLAVSSGGPFQRPPSNSGKVLVSRPATVLVNNLPLAVLGDPVTTCNDPTDAPTCTIATGSPNVVVS
jgi:uncharacterized Zn-binding protein involved in type VI secretion